MSLAELMQAMGREAVRAAEVLAGTSADRRTRALQAAAAELRGARRDILAANAEDVRSAEERALGPALIDRLRLDDARVAAMARALEELAGLPDPVGRVLREWRRPNGLVIQRVSVPLGVVGIIYESRPNVTAEAAAICLRSANAVILRGGGEALASSKAIHAAMTRGLAAAELPSSCIQLVPTADRAAVGHLLADMREYLDVLVPRGGRSLVARVQQEARVPVIGHLEGNCHVYVDRGADLEMARRIVLNAKLRRTGVCGAAETLLVDRACTTTHLAPLVRALLDAGCEVRGDEHVQPLDGRVRAATEEDWRTEYLDAVIAVRVVEGVEGAIGHIAMHGSDHTESIVTDDAAAAETFLTRVDSAIVLHNASTQFADGGEFGMGAEIGISTDRLHARGPVGAEELTSYKYVVRGTGQIRP